jgi:hypothetical protein
MPNTAEVQIQVRKGTAAQWSTANPVLLTGEIGWETDTNYWKFGDGTTAYNDLPRMNPNPPSNFLLMGA